MSLFPIARRAGLDGGTVDIKGKGRARTVDHGTVQEKTAPGAWSDLGVDTGRYVKHRPAVPCGAVGYFTL